MQAPSEGHVIALCQGLRVRLGGCEVVRGFDLSIAAGERVALIGGSGSGKTTVARALAGLWPAGAVEASRLEIGGIDVLRGGEAAWRRVRGREVGFAWQDAQATLDPLQTVGSALGEAIALHRPGPSSARAAEARELLRAVELGDDGAVARKRPHELSGGQRQRVGLALALAGRPRLLIADEPSSALDGPLARHLAGLLRALCGGRPGWPALALLLVSHDLRLVKALCTRSLVVADGVVVESGAVGDLIDRPAHAATRALVAHAGFADA